MLEKLFKLKEHHTDVKTEIVAGITTLIQKGATTVFESILQESDDDLILLPKIKLEKIFNDMGGAFEFRADEAERQAEPITSAQLFLEEEHRAEAHPDRCRIIEQGRICR